MHFDPNNAAIKLCANRMALEGEVNFAEASALHEQAWQLAGKYLEQYWTTHELARNGRHLCLNFNWPLSLF